MKKQAADELESLRQKMAIRQAEAEAKEQAYRLEQQRAQKQADAEFEQLRQQMAIMEKQLMN